MKDDKKDDDAKAAMNAKYGKMAECSGNGQKRRPDVEKGDDYHDIPPEGFVS